MTADDLRAVCRERLAGYKLPGEFEFVADLPKTAKIQKYELRSRE